MKKETRVMQMNVNITQMKGLDEELFSVQLNALGEDNNGEKIMFSYPSHPEVQPLNRKQLFKLLEESFDK